MTSTSSAGAARRLVLTAAAAAAALLLSGCAAVPFLAGGSDDGGSVTDAPAKDTDRTPTPAPKVTPVAAATLPGPVDYSGMTYTVTQVVLHAPYPDGDPLTGSTALPTPVRSGTPVGVLVRLTLRNTTEVWKLPPAQLGLTNGTDVAEAQVRPVRGESIVQSGTTVEATAYFDTVDPVSLDGWTFDVHESGTIPAVMPAAGTAPADAGYPVAVTVGPLGPVRVWNTGGGATVAVTKASLGLDGLPAYGARARKDTRFLTFTLQVAHRPVKSYFGTVVFFTFTQDVRAVADGITVPVERCENADGGDLDVKVQPGTTAEAVCTVEVPAAAKSVAISVGDPARGGAKTAAVTAPALPPVPGETGAPAGGAAGGTAAATPTPSA